MLVLTRRIGECIIIGDDINISVLGVKGNQVRLGINAPKEMPIYRQEIYSKIKLAKDSKKGTDSLLDIAQYLQNSKKKLIIKPKKGNENG